MRSDARIIGFSHLPTLIFKNGKRLQSACNGFGFVCVCVGTDLVEEVYLSEYCVCVYFKVWPRHLFISELAEQI